MDTIGLIVAAISIPLSLGMIFWSRRLINRFVYAAGETEPARTPIAVLFATGASLFLFSIIALGILNTGGYRAARDLWDAYGISLCITLPAWLITYPLVLFILDGKSQYRKELLRRYQNENYQKQANETNFGSRVKREEE